jgi:flagellar basal-body rod protein FlgF
MQVSAQSQRAHTQRLSESRIDKQLASAPKRHDIVDAILASISLSPLFDRTLSNGVRIANTPSEIKMDQLLITAAAGMKARMDSLDMHANNMSNSGTPGFKSDREFYGLYEQSLPVIERQYTDFSQGPLLPTGNPLDVGLNGKGFFALNSPSGIVFTRSGNFRLSASNELATQDGYTLRNVLDNGKPIVVDPKQQVDIAKDGTVSQAGQTLGQIEIAQPESPSDTLKKLGNTNFGLIDQSAIAPAADAATEVMQGQIEQSNVPVTDSAGKLVSVMRQFEMMQKAIILGTEMNKQMIADVAKPS